MAEEVYYESCLWSSGTQGKAGVIINKVILWFIWSHQYNKVIIKMNAAKLSYIIYELPLRPLIWWEATKSVGIL